MKAKQTRYHPRLSDDVGEALAKLAKKNGRTLPQELDFILRPMIGSFTVQSDGLHLQWNPDKMCYDNPPTMVTLNMDMIPPTYWAPAQWRSYATTCIYPGTEKSANPVKHTREQVDAQLRRSGYSKLIPKKKAKR